MKKIPVNISEFENTLKTVFGNTTKISKIDEIVLGATKHTYKIKTNINEIILYVWKEPHTNLTITDTESTEILYGNGLNYFVQNHKFLKECKINVPDLYYKDSTRTISDYDYAIVEYISRGDLQEFKIKNVDITYMNILDELKENIKILNSNKSDFFGKLFEEKRYNLSPERVVHNQLLMEFSLVKKYCSEAKEIESIINTIEIDENIIEEKNKYSLIHPEICPEHVLISDDLKPYLIDFESLLYFDIEFQLAEIKLREEKLFNLLTTDNINQEKLYFYEIYFLITWLAFSSEAIVKETRNIDFYKMVQESSLKRLLDTRGIQSLGLG